jgi:zinc transport system substrate-binding protein
MRIPFGRVAPVLVVLLAAAFAAVGCRPGPSSQTWTGEVKVATSFPALYCFAANVVGDVGTVKSIKSTQGAHGSEVTAQDREMVETADVLFINGLGLDDTFAKNLTKTTNNGRLTVIDVGGQMGDKYLLHSDGCECKHEDGDGHHHHGDHDPHVWLGPDQAKRMVEVIRKELCGKYPAHAATFTKNAEAYSETLVALKAEGQEKLKATKKGDRKIVTVHGSMNYFAAAFDLTVAGVVQTTPGKEPSDKELKELIEACKKDKVRVIAAEPQFSTRGAVKTLTDELSRAGIANPVVIELDPLETATRDELNPGWYEAKMRTNIAAAAKVFGQ